MYWNRFWTISSHLSPLLFLSCADYKSCMQHHRNGHLAERIANNRMLSYHILFENHTRQDANLSSYIEDRYVVEYPLRCVRTPSQPTTPEERGVDWWIRIYLFLGSSLANPLSTLHYTILHQSCSTQWTDMGVYRQRSSQAHSVAPSCTFQGC